MHMVHIPYTGIHTKLYIKKNKTNKQTNKQKQRGTGETDHKFRALAVLPEDQNSVFSTHVSGSHSL